MLNEINQHVASRWGNIHSIACLLFISSVMFGCITFVLEISSAIQIVFPFVVSMTFGLASIIVCMKHYILNIENKLKSEFEQLKGKTWSIYNHDGACIGGIDSEPYLSARIKVDTCMKTKLLQICNSLEVFFNLIMNSAMFSIGFIFFGVLTIFIIDPEAYQTKMESLNETSSLLIYLIPFFIFIFVFKLVLKILACMLTRTMPPRYVSYSSKQLKILLSRHVPNIATADGGFYLVLNLDMCDREEIEPEFQKA